MLKYHKGYHTTLADVRQRIAYGVHVLQQTRSSRKRTLMAYFACNFFHDGRVREAVVDIRTNTLRFSLTSAPAINNAYDLARDGKGKAGALEAEFNRDDFLHEVLFTSVRILRLTSGKDEVPSMFSVFDAMEFTDAPTESFPKTFTLAELSFHRNPNIRFAFRTVEVRPLFPDRFASYFTGSPGPTYGLLKGRNLRDALMRKIEQWQQAYEDLAGEPYKPRESRLSKPQGTMSDVGMTAPRISSTPT